MTSPDLIQIVQEYDWECIECKTCQECVLKENEVNYKDNDRGLVEGMS